MRLIIAINQQFGYYAFMGNVFGIKQKLFIFIITGAVLAQIFFVPTVIAATSRAIDGSAPEPVASQARATSSVSAPASDGAAKPTPTPPAVFKEPATGPQITEPVSDPSGPESIPLWTKIGLILSSIGLILWVLKLPTSLFKNENEGKKEESGKCNYLKATMDQKMKELTDLEGKLKGKIKGSIKEAMEDALLIEEEKVILREIETAKAEYEKIKALYEECIVDVEGGSKLVLVKALKEDIGVLIEIEKLVAGQKTYSAMLTMEEWLEQFNKENNKIFFVKRGEEVLGEVSYEIKEPGHAYIDGLVIKPNFQGQGIGREVMKIILEELKDFKRIDLVTHPDNTAAVKLYQSMGFIVESRKENYFDDGEPRLVLVLNK